MLKIRQFEKRYYDKTILHVDELTIDEGITWIKGENGAGKSTLFKSISGLIPAKGSMEFDDGISLQRNPVQYRMRVNYSEAEPLYPSYLTASDLIQFVGRARKASREQQRHYIEAFGIQSFLSDPCGSYSSGMLKKVSLAMAFLGDPSLIILDEPLITLDINSQQNLIRIIEEKLAAKKIAFLLSSHQQFATDVLSTTYVILNHTLVKA